MGEHEPVMQSGHSIGWVALGLAFGACALPPDRGGQEGEEFRGIATESDLDSGTSGGDGGGGDDGEDPGGGDVGLSDFVFERVSGERIHLRGSDGPSDYFCSIAWDVAGVRQDELCPECDFALDLSYTLREADSTRDPYTCADAWVDVSLQVGIVVNYGSYGPAVLGIVSETGYTYLLGPAILSDTGAIWSYGYRDGGGSAAPDSYGTWYYRVDAVFE